MLRTCLAVLQCCRDSRLSLQKTTNDLLSLTSLSSVTQVSSGTLESPADPFLPEKNPILT